MDELAKRALKAINDGRSGVTKFSTWNTLSELLDEYNRLASRELTLEEAQARMEEGLSGKSNSGQQ